MSRSSYWWLTVLQNVIFTFIPCILILSKFFYSPTNVQVNVLKTIFKFTLK